MPELIEKSPPSSIKILGPIDIQKLPTAADLSAQNNSSISKPPLDTLINSYDFEAVAEKTCSPKAWAFFSSAATDLISMRLNKETFNHVLFRPRVMKNNKDVDTTTTILGIKTKAPFFIAPTAMAKMIHEDGELAVSKGAGTEGIVHIVSNRLLDDRVLQGISSDNIWLEIARSPPTLQLQLPILLRLAWAQRAKPISSNFM